MSPQRKTLGMVVRNKKPITQISQKTNTRLRRIQREKNLVHLGMGRSWTLLPKCKSRQVAILFFFFFFLIVHLGSRVRDLLMLKWTRFRSLWIFYSLIYIYCVQYLRNERFVCVCARARVQYLCLSLRTLLESVPLNPIVWCYVWHVWLNVVINKLFYYYKK